MGHFQGGRPGRCLASNEMQLRTLIGPKCLFLSSMPNIGWLFRNSRQAIFDAGRMLCIFLFRPLLNSRISVSRSMSSHAFLDASPPAYHGPRERLDRSAFRKTLTVLSARVPQSKTGQLLKAQPLRGCVLECEYYVGVSSHHS